MQMITAKVIRESDENISCLQHDLEVGKEYPVSLISVCSFHTDIYLQDRNKIYNSVYFEFFEDGKPLDIFKDKRFNPYIR